MIKRILLVKLKSLRAEKLALPLLSFNNDFGKASKSILSFIPIFICI